MARKKRQNSTQPLQPSFIDENSFSMNQGVTRYNNGQRRSSMIPLTDITNSHYKLDSQSTVVDNKIKTAEARRNRKTILNRKRKRPTTDIHESRHLSNNGSIVSAQIHTPIRDIRYTNLVNVSTFSPLTFAGQRSFALHSTPLSTTTQHIVNDGVAQTSPLVTAPSRFYRGSSSTRPRNDDGPLPETPTSTIYNPLIITTTQSGNAIPSSSRLASGGYKIKGNKVITKNLNPVPINLEDTDEESDDANSMSGISPEYLAHGDNTYVCNMCGAHMWYDETLRGGTHGNRHGYSLCCLHGKVELPTISKQPPELFVDLLRNRHPMSKNFINNIRAYNMMFSFTSMTGKVDKTINRGNGPYCYRLHGKNSHRLGTLVPSEGQRPKFGQLYIYDTANEMNNRMSALSSKHGSSINVNSTSNVDQLLAIEIQGLLDAQNPLVQVYRMARDRFQQDSQQKISLRLIGRRSKDGRQYDLPTTDEVAALIVGDIGVTFDHRDIILEKQEGGLKRISELHPSYLALQYPLLLPYAEDGYRTDIPHREVADDGSVTKLRTRVTMREYFAYKIQERDHGFSLLLNSRKLFQQYLVDAYTMIEAERLSYIRKQQQKT